MALIPVSANRRAICVGIYIYSVHVRPCSTPVAEAADSLSFTCGYDHIYIYAVNHVCHTYDAILSPLCASRSSFLLWQLALIIHKLFYVCRCVRAHACVCVCVRERGVGGGGGGEVNHVKMKRCICCADLQFS